MGSHLPGKRHIDEDEGLSVRCIAHDLNNVLAAILGSADLALDRYERGADPRPHLHDIVLTSYRATGLVRLLMQAGKRERPARRRVSLASITEEVLDSLKNEIPGDVEVQTQLLSSGPVLGDAVQLYRMVLNLLTNALQAMTATGGTLELGLSEATTARGAGLVLTVRDTGAGILPEDQARVFEPFFTTREDQGGTGLGLSVVRDVVEDHRGWIGIESSAGEGTTFTVHLPLADP